MGFAPIASGEADELARVRRRFASGPNGVQLPFEVEVGNGKRDQTAGMQVRRSREPAYDADPAAGARRREDRCCGTEFDRVRNLRRDA